VAAVVRQAERRADGADGGAGTQALLKAGNGEAVDERVEAVSDAVCIEAERGFRGARVAEAAAAQVHTRRVRPVFDQAARDGMSVAVEGVEGNGPAAPVETGGTIDRHERTAVAMPQTPQTRDQLLYQLQHARREPRDADAIAEQESVLERRDVEEVRGAVLEPVLQ